MLFHVLLNHASYLLTVHIFQSIAEFDLKTVRYEVKSPQCHELSLAAPPHDKITFNFRCEQEAQEWATVVMSSLREARRGLHILGEVFFFVFVYSSISFRMLLFSFSIISSLFCFQWPLAPHLRMDGSILILQIHRAPHQCRVQVVFYFSAQWRCQAKYKVSIVLMQISRNQLHDQFSLRFPLSPNPLSHAYFVVLFAFLSRGDMCRAG